MSREHPEPAPATFGSFGAEWHAPPVFWYIGGTDPEAYEKARKAGRISEDIPANHSPNFAPTVHPTLETGVEAMVVAARNGLGAIFGHPLLTSRQMYLYLMDLVGVFAFAVSGALTAGRRGMDLFGVLVVAAVTAIGGGTVRDVLLDRPVFWLTDTSYLSVIAAAALCTLVYARFRRPPRGALLVADAFGLAVFAVLGVRAGLEAGVSPLVAVIMGAITGTVGGAVRDVLCGETPMILRREIYATAAIAGATTYVALVAWTGSGAITLTTAIAVTLLLRLSAVWFDLNLPTERPKE